MSDQGENSQQELEPEPPQDQPKETPQQIQPQPPQVQQVQPQYVPQQSQPAIPIQRQYAPQASQADIVRALAATKSYYGSALLTLALYWLTFWIGGAIANVLYLNSANNAQRLSGVSPEGKGCLWVLLITHFGIPLLILGLWFGAIILSAFTNR
jgi:hypothetical protein